MLRKGLLVGVFVVGMLSVVAATTGDLRLADAGMRGDIDAVRSLLQQKVDVNAAQGDGMTALHWAVYRDDLDMARMPLIVRDYFWFSVVIKNI